jgi:uncharacterized membrane protein YdjX (TVP38/TMEM64 family)
VRRYGLLAAGTACVLLATFLLAQRLHWGVLEDPRPALARLGRIAPAASFVLLVGDVFLPVPSSLLMVGNGALLGVAGGTLLSTAGGLGAAQLAFWIGRRSAGLVARLTNEDERRAVSRLLARWGTLAILLTRPVPILAETSALLAGTTSMTWAQLSLGAVLGTLPPALAYAAAGAHARHADAGLVWLAVLVVAGLFGALGVFLRSRLS